MTSRTIHHRLLACATGIAVAISSACVSPRSVESAGDGSKMFEGDVKPILEQHCLRCHNGTTLPKALDLRNVRTAFASRQRNGRPFIVPGQPDASLLITAISRPGNHPMLMPQQPVSLTDMEIGALREWIAGGAKWPADPTGDLRARPDPENP